MLACNFTKFPSLGLAVVRRGRADATGFASPEYRMSGKWLELLKQISPAVTWAAFIRDRRGSKFLLDDAHLSSEVSEPLDLEHQLCRHPRLRLRGIRTSDQRSNQAQEFLLLWSVPIGNEKGSDVNVGDLATRGEVGLVPDEHPPDIRIAGEQPPIPVRTAVNLSGPNSHANCSITSRGISPIKRKPPLGGASRRPFLPAFRVA
jgi:hypothetical protein